MLRNPTNPLREGLRMQLTPEPCTLVFFGATGDLTHRKLLPALYNLGLDGFLPTGFSVVGAARRPKTDQEFRDKMREAINKFSRSRPIRQNVWEVFEQGIFYVQCDFGD